MISGFSLPCTLIYISRKLMLPWLVLILFFCFLISMVHFSLTKWCNFVLYFRVKISWLKLVLIRYTSSFSIFLNPATFLSRISVSFLCRIWPISNVIDANDTSSKQLIRNVWLVQVWIIDMDLICWWPCFLFEAIFESTLVLTSFWLASEYWENQGRWGMPNHQNHLIIVCAEYVCPLRS